MKYDVVVIGGSAAGLISAKTAKLSHKSKSVLVIRKEEKSLVPCGIPYVFSTLEKVDDNMMGIDPLKQIGVEFLIEEVLKIDTEQKKVSTVNKLVEYDKLIVATGSTPYIPPIEGVELEGVYNIPKDYDYISAITPKLKNAKKVVVIGAGFIGLELSDELSKEVEKLTLIEARAWVLPLAFDKEVAEIVSAHMTTKGTEILLDTKVQRINGENGKVVSVELENGKTIEADAVVMSIGYRPNTSLAREAGLHMGYMGAIWVDEYLRTSVPDVFAAGDCAEHKDYFTRKSSNLMLASTATFDARIAGTNLFSLQVIRKNKGNISIFSSAIDGLAMGAAGLTEDMAKAEGFDILVGKFSGIDRHPGTLKDKTQQHVKLIFSKNGGTLLGAQVVSGKSTGELINILGLAIQKDMTACELATLQFGTHPLLTSAPTMYPIVNAAESVMRIMCKQD